MGHNRIAVAYRGTKIFVDEELVNLLKALWEHGVVTYQCCQGGLKFEGREGTFGFQNTYLDFKGIRRTKASLIFRSSDLKCVKALLPIDTEYFVGDGLHPGTIKEWLSSFEATWASFIFRNERSEQDSD